MGCSWDKYFDKYSRAIMVCSWDKYFTISLTIEINFIIYMLVTINKNKIQS